MSFTECCLIKQEQLLLINKCVDDQNIKCSHRVTESVLRAYMATDMCESLGLYSGVVDFFFLEMTLCN